MYRATVERASGVGGKAILGETLDFQLEALGHGVFLGSAREPIAGRTLRNRQRCPNANARYWRQVI